MKRHWRREALAMGVMTLLGVFGSAVEESSAQEPREVRLGVELTPDMPDPSDERVAPIHVESKGALVTADASESVSIGESSGAHFSELGLGALYWAVHHPRHAWLILLPIQPGVEAPEATLKESAPRGAGSRVAGPPLG